jgi:hypothetical protein
MTHLFVLNRLLHRDYRCNFGILRLPQGQLVGLEFLRRLHQVSTNLCVTAEDLRLRLIVIYSLATNSIAIYIAL